MGKIKKLLENELIGGTQSTDVYPVTSVKAVYDENNKSLDNIIKEIENAIISTDRIANGAITKDKLSTDIQSLVDNIRSVSRGVVLFSDIDTCKESGLYMVKDHGVEYLTNATAVLEVFWDSMNHIIYQRLLVNCLDPNTGIANHNDTELPKVWIRRYNNKSPNDIGIPKGTWSAWELMDDSSTIIGTDNIEDGAVTDSKLATDIQTLISSIEDKTSEITKEVIKTEEDFISIKDNNDNEVFLLDKDGLNAKNVKSNGKGVLTEQDISGLATKEEVTKKQDLIPQVSQEETTDNEEEAVFSSDDDNEVYARVGSYGIKAKAILDLNGNPIQEEKIILPDYFKAEAVETGNTIKSFATSSATVFNIVTDTHERYWESDDVRAYDMSFENIRNVNKIYKSNALIHLGDILSPNNTNTGKYDSQDVVNAHLKSFFERMRNAHENSVIMLGNHEDIHGAGGGGDAKAIYPSVAIYDYSYNRYKNRPFFYINNSTGKIRSIFLCCPYQWEGKSSNWTFGQEQIDWLIDTALNVENDWHCIFFSHTPLVSNDMSSSDYQDVIGVINAFNSQTTFTTSYGKVADFSGKAGTKSVAWVCGHEHYDLVVEPKDKTVYPNNDLDCHIIVICCHYRYGASGSVPGASYYDTAYRTQLNANRDLWDTLIYRKDQSKIYMIRFGAGEDRVINI